MSFANLLKRIPLAANLNAKRRAWQVEARYDRLVSEYASRSIDRSMTELWSDRGLDSLSLSVPPRVLFCGTDELQDYGGFIQALSEHADTRIFRRARGGYGQSVDGIAWMENATAMRDLLDELGNSGWIPEVLMMQSMGYRFHPSDLEELKRRYGFAIVNIGMDERLAYRVGEFEGVELGIAGLNRIVDLALVTVPEAVAWYRTEGVPAKYFPLASSSAVYYPRPEVPNIYDVGFIGRAYGRRQELAQRIASSGLSFRGHGPGWEAGALEVKQNNEFYNSCRVVLGTGNIGYSRTLMNPKLRDFEVPLAGVPYLTNYTPELAQLFVEDKEMVFYRSDAELVDKASWLVRDPSAAAAIGAAGHARAINEHQYDDRFSVLFDQILRGEMNVEFVPVGTE